MGRKKEYRLCYIDKNHVAWFTDNFEKQWGDDWNDKPYEYNAEEPYSFWSELVEYNDDITKRKYKDHKINHKKVYFETNDWTELLAEDLAFVSVEEINQDLKVPWLQTDTYKIYAGLKYEEFIHVVEYHGGVVYVPRLQDDKIKKK